MVHSSACFDLINMPWPGTNPQLPPEVLAHVVRPELPDRSPWEIYQTPFPRLRVLLISSPASSETTEVVFIALKVLFCQLDTHFVLVLLLSSSNYNGNCSRAYWHCMWSLLAIYPPFAAVTPTINASYRPTMKHFFTPRRQMAPVPTTHTMV